jgi:hypothetical protein
MRMQNRQVAQLRRNLLSWYRGHRRTLPRGRSLSLIVLTAALVTLFSSAAQAQKVAKQKPLWQKDPRQFGLPDQSDSLSWNRIAVSPGSTGFQNNDTLILTWITPDQPLPKLPKRTKFSPPSVVPSRLHIVFLDAKTGEKTKEQDLPVPSAPTGLFITHAGNLLVRAGDSVDLYSPDFAHLGQAKFPLPLDWKYINSASRLEISPDGRRILLCSVRGLSAESELLDTEDLQPLGHLLEAQQGCPEQLGNDFVLFRTKKEDSNQLMMQRDGEEPRSLVIPTAGTQPKGPLPWVQVVNGDAFVAFIGSRIEICSDDGKLLFEDMLPKRHGFWPGATARDSDRFAVLKTRLRGLTIPSLDIYDASPSLDELSVYSVEEQRTIFTVRPMGTSPWTPWPSYALSPDGSLLAISSRVSMEVYKLP